MPSPLLEHPSAGIFTQLTEQIAEKEAEKKSKKESVIEEIQETIEKEIPNIKDLSKQAQVDAFVHILEEKQKELLREGKLEGANSKNIIEGATQAIIHHPEFTEPILEAIGKFGINAKNILDEINNLYFIRTNILRIITTRLPSKTEEPIKEEPSISVVEEPIKEEEPIEMILEEGRMVPYVSPEGGKQQEGETGVGIPVGEARRRIRGRPRKRGAKSVSKSSRLVGKTIGRKPKRKRKFGRRGKVKLESKKQTRRRKRTTRKTTRLPTTRRRTTRRRTTRRRTRK
jgi:hypothetical protein